eukprot:scaffold17867_cov27-Tisochrysis_lutea.AAC.1
MARTRAVRHACPHALTRAHLSSHVDAGSRPRKAHERLDTGGRVVRRRAIFPELDEDEVDDFRWRLSDGRHGHVAVLDLLEVGVDWVGNVDARPE